MKQHLYARVTAAPGGSRLALRFRPSPFLMLVAMMNVTVMIVSCANLARTQAVYARGAAAVTALILLALILIHRWTAPAEKARLLQFVTEALDLTPAGTAPPLRMPTGGGPS